MVTITVDKKSIELTNEEWDFLKKYIIEDTLCFWEQTKQQTDKFPYELFEDEIVKKIQNIRKDTLDKLEQININVYKLNT